MGRRNEDMTPCGLYDPVEELGSSEATENPPQTPHGRPEIAEIDLSNMKRNATGAAH